jgi:hypothetical protein
MGDGDEPVSRRRLLTLSALSVGAVGLAAPPARAQAPDDAYVASGSQVLDPRDYGAVGDGATDDTAALNLALDAALVGNGVVLLTPGAYRCTGTLFLDGAASLVGSPGAELIVSAAGAVTGGWQIHLAVGTRARWQGQIRGVTWRAAPELGSGVTHLVNLFDAIDYEIVGNRFYGFTSCSVVKGANNTAWAEDDGAVRRRGLYAFNLIDCTQPRTGGGEGLSVSKGKGPDNWADGMRFIANEVIGVGDDPIGIHGGQDVEVIGNVLSSQEGRILIADTRGFVISGNSCEHVSASGGSGFIWLSWESPVTPRGCSDGLISDNRIRIAPGQSVAYGVRVRGAHGVMVASNMVRNDSTTLTNAILVEAVDAFGVSRKSGEITVQGNHIAGGRIRIAALASRDGWVKLGPNYIDGQSKVSPLVDFASSGLMAGDEVHCAGAHGSSTPSTYAVHGSGVTNVQTLDTWGSTDLPATGDVVLGLTGAMTTRTLRRRFVVTEILIRVDAAVSGTVTVTLQRNGVRWKSTTLGAADGLEKLVHTAPGVLSTDPFAPGDVLGIVVTPGGRATGRSIEVEVRGVPMTS